jgi:hypothetical protein
MNPNLFRAPISCRPPSIVDDSSLLGWHSELYPEITAPHQALKSAGQAGYADVGEPFQLLIFA